jgi:predicted nucleotidyltransferase component of viral defense system
MKPLLMDELQSLASDADRFSFTREFLQARILLSLQDHGAFSNWAFSGGTALRFLYALPRYSEDLDFSIVRPGDDPRFAKLIRGVESDLAKEAYTVETRIRADKVVASAWIKFRGILHEAGISPHRDQALSVKVEIDTRPPAGAALENRRVRRFVMLNLLHYDKASLLAGKLHAVLMRKYTKGRDLFDLAWYLSDPDWPDPNLDLLNNALEQSGWPGDTVTPGNWRALVADKLESADWKAALSDVTPFLMRAQDVSWVSPDVILPLLR